MSPTKLLVGKQPSETAAVGTAVGLTAHRVAQESMANVLHHAGPTRMDVRIAFSPEALELVVANEPGTDPLALRPPSTGLGLLGSISSAYRKPHTC